MSSRGAVVAGTGAVVEVALLIVAVKVELRRGVVGDVAVADIGDMAATAAIISSATALLMLMMLDITLLDVHGLVRGQLLHSTRTGGKEVLWAECKG